MRAAVVILVTQTAIGCGGAETDPSQSPGPCDPPNRIVDDRCLSPGVTEDGCPAGTLGQDDGSCRPAGMLAEHCADGFVHVPFDDAAPAGEATATAGWCEPVLPAGPCPFGQMAVPGDSACRPVMECGSGTWGDIPRDAATQHVDASFSGGASDGSAAAPWTTIGEAVSQAPAGGLVAVAKGSYQEDVIIWGKPVRLYGVCPEAVEVVATGVETAALFIGNGADGSELHGLSVRGPAVGVVLSGSQQLLLDELWIHDNASRGLNLQTDLGPTEVVVRGSLIEENHDYGVFVAGSEATIEASVVRRTQPKSGGLGGRGIGIQTDAATPSLARIRGTVVEDNRETGVYISASEATVEGTVVRGTDTNAQGIGGRGISIQEVPAEGWPAFGTVRGALVEDNREAGVHVLGSEATIEDTVVRHTSSNGQEIGGRGIDVVSLSATGPTSVATIRGVLVEDNLEYGMHVSGSLATIEASVVRRTLADVDGLFGRGINIQLNLETGASSLAAVRGVRVEDNREIGIFIAASEVAVEGALVRRTEANAEGRGGRGISIQSDSATGLRSLVALRGVQVDDSRDHGIIVIESDASLEWSLVRRSMPSGMGLFGDGVTAAHQRQGSAPPTLLVDASRIEDSARAGISSFGGVVVLGRTAVQCAAFDLNAEPYLDADANFEDRGGNGCGCPEAGESCAAVSAKLAPPQTVE